MPSKYNTRRGSGSVYNTKRRTGGTTTRTQTKAKPKQDGHSVGGFLGNLGGGARDAIYGLPRGLYESGKAELDLLGYAYSLGQNKVNDDTERLGREIVESYKQTYGRGWEGLYENPFQVLLDATAVASGGAGAAARAGLSPALRTTLRTPSGRLVEKPRSRRALRRNAQAARDKALGLLPETTPKIGEYARAGRVTRRQEAAERLSAELEAVPFSRAISKLHTKEERAAAHAYLRLGGSTKLYGKLAGTWKQGDRFQKAQAALLLRPKTRELYANPTEAMRKAMGEARSLADNQAARLKLDPETVEASRFRWARALTPDEYVWARTLPGAENPFGMREVPVYLPDVSAGRSGTLSVGFRGGGTAQQTRIGPERFNQGILFREGRIRLDPTTLTGSFMQSVKKQSYDRTHETLLQDSKPLTFAQAKSADLRKWSFVKERRADRVPYTLRSQGDVEDYLRGETKEFQGGLDIRDVVTDSLDEAASAEGVYHAIPKEYVKAVAGEFTRSATLFYKLNKTPVAVWRALVLNLRPAWLVNNIIGNSLLYALHHGNPNGVRSLLESFKRSWPDDADRFEQIIRTHMPEQTVAGTFIGSQRPTRGFHSRAVRYPAKAIESLADVDRAWEALLRRAAVKAELRKHPALREYAPKMRRDTKDFMGAVEKTLTDDPVVAREISDRVNTALGDFTSLSSFEKNVVRSVFPFYAWFRAITGITLKLPLEQPVKTALLARLGEIGAATNLAELGVNPEDVPPFLVGMIPIGPESGGRRPSAVTGPANPFTTVSELGEFANALVAGGPGEAAREAVGFNPYLQGLYEQFSGTSASTGSPLPDRGGGGLNPLIAVLAGLPQVRLGTAAAGRQYTGTPAKPTLYDQDFYDLLLRYLGLPYARVSTRRAEQIQDRRR